MSNARDGNAYHERVAMGYVGTGRRDVKGGRKILRTFDDRQNFGNFDFLKKEEQLFKNFYSLLKLLEANL